MGSGKHERCHNSLQNGGNIISLYGAAKQYNVPRMTLSDRIHGKVSTDPMVGHLTVLSKEEEDSMVNCGIRHVTVPLATRILIANVRHIGVSNICVINLV